ncbi:hypothetical protein [Xylanimonas ulmi]|uniref:Uncharacterized protein n=1 Tax=Xylanimonas ulmi TaxID=228973 RepID=A0A4Q7M012_9MICO|nr:hypothetical protein [Xylanibacterium ulmi]RZS60644.1 hypothetical protein EV386_0914 [Xylanibacterium ulmi]
MARTLSRSQVLAWSDRWSFTDRQLIEAAIDALSESDFYEPNSAGYIGARVDGRVAMYIAPGYIFWNAAQWLDAIDPALLTGEIVTDGNGRFYALSNFQDRSSGTPDLAEIRAPCPNCFTVPSETGACFCD